MYSHILCSALGSEAIRKMKHKISLTLHSLELNTFAVKSLKHSRLFDLTLFREVSNKTKKLVRDNRFELVRSRPGCVFFYIKLFDVRVKSRLVTPSISFGPRLLIMISQ